MPPQGGGYGAPPMPMGMPQGMPPGMPQGMPPGMPQGMPPGMPQGMPQQGGSMGMGAPQGMVGFGAPPPQINQNAYPAAPAFAPPPGAPPQMGFQAQMGPPPVTSGAMPPAPPPIVGLMSGAGLAPPAPPPIVAPPPVMGGYGGPPAVVGPPPPVPPPALPQSPGVLSGPMPAASPAGMTGNGILVGFLVTFQNEPSGIFWPIRSGRTQLGRAGSDKTDIGINDASSSSRHATVTADPSTGQAFVQDDGSRNGTFLNEQKLPPGEQRQLHDNDRLRLGSTTLVVKLLVS